MGKVTIESLAIMIQKSFLHADQKFEEFKGEMYEFRDETRFALYELDQHARKTDGRLDCIEGRLDKIEARLDIVEDKLEVVIMEVRGHEKRVTSLEMNVLPA